MVDRWTRAFFTVVVLSAVGALSLARWGFEKLKQMSRKQTKAGSTSQPSEIEHESDIEKLETQWMIIQLEAALEEQQEERESEGVET